MPFIPTGYLDLDKAKALIYACELDLRTSEFVIEEVDINNRAKWKASNWRPGTSLEEQISHERWRNRGDFPLVRLGRPIEMFHFFGEDPVDVFVQHPSLDDNRIRAGYGIRIEFAEKYDNIPKNIGLPEGLRPEISPFDCLTIIRRRLSDGKISANIIDSGGQIVAIPASFWNSDPAWDVLRHNVTAYISLDGKYISGPVVVCVKSIAASYTFDGVFESDDTDDVGMSADDVPPFLQFMLRAVAGLGLGRGKRVDKGTIVGWLAANWPLELGEASERKLDYMATFLRPPDDQNGGFYKEERQAPRLPKPEKGAPP